MKVPMNTVAFLTGLLCTAAGGFWMASAIEGERPRGSIRGSWFEDPVLLAGILVGVGVIILVVMCVRGIADQRHRQHEQPGKTNREDDADAAPRPR